MPLNKSTTSNPPPPLFQIFLPQHTYIPPSDQRDYALKQKYPPPPPGFNFFCSQHTYLKVISAMRQSCDEAVILSHPSPSRLPPRPPW